MTSTLPMSRRNFAIGAASMQLVALPAQAQGSEIQRLYKIWWDLYSEYFSYDAQWQQKEITNGEYMAVVDPVLDRCAQIEDQIFAIPSQTNLDLAIKVNISAHYDWGMFHMQDGLLADAQRLAGSIGPEMGKGSLV